MIFFRSHLFAWLAFGVLATGGLSGCAEPLDVVRGALPGAERPLGYVKTNLDPEKTTVQPGERITLWVETPAASSEVRFAWSAASGSLSAVSGSRVVWTAGGQGRVRVVCTLSAGGDTRVVEYVFNVR